MEKFIIRAFGKKNLSISKFYKEFIFLFIFIIFFSCTPASNINSNDNISNNQIKNKNWTIMLYLGADNNLEYDLVRNVKQVKQSYQGGCNLIIFIDRSKKYSVNSTVFGGNFTGGHIYKAVENDLELLDSGSLFSDISDTTGDQINSANIQVLKKFIEYSKSNYPAKYYSLIIGSHGGGARRTDISNQKNVVFDEVYNRWIYTAEFTDYLEEKDSVDLFGLDACFMGNIEFLYQIRNNNGGFHAKYIVASSPTEWSYGWNYSGVLKRITDYETIVEDVTSDITGEKRTTFFSGDLTPLNLGKIIIEEQYNYTSVETDSQVLALYDTDKLTDLKSSIDSLFVSLKDNSSDIQSIRGTYEISQQLILSYFNTTSASEWIDYCYFDIYDVCDKIIDSGKFSSEINDKAELVKQNAKSLIINSFGQGYFKRFRNNVNGVSFFFPNGDRLYNDKSMWSYETWYNANPDKESYGKLSFCQDNAIQRNGIIENYFEVLDYWFDITDDKGGYNGYSY